MLRLAPMAVVLFVCAAIATFYFTVKPALYVAVLSVVALVTLRACLNDAARRELGIEPLFVAVALPLAAWMLPAVSLLYLAAFLVVPLLARRGSQAAALYLFALLLLPGLDQTIMIGSLKLFDFGVHDALACGAALSLLMRPGWRGRIGVVSDLPFLAVFLVLVAGSARETSITHFVRVLLDMGLDCALPYYIVSRAIRGADDVRAVMLHLTAGALILSMILLYEMRGSWPIYNLLYDHYQIETPLLVKFRGGFLRTGGPFVESTSIAMVLACCFLAAWMSRERFRSPVHHMAVLALLLLGLVAPQSRGAWVGLIVGVAMIELYRGRVRQLIARGVAIALLAGGAVTIARSSPQLSESIGLSGQSTDTVDYRERLFSRGIEELGDSPVIGFAMPEILRRLPDMVQGENIVDFVNTYIFVALVSGLLGLAAFVAAFAMHLIRIWGARTAWRRRERTDLRAAAFAFGMMAMLMEMLFFTSMGGRPQTFVFVSFALAAALAGKARRPAAVAKAQPGWPSAGISSTLAAMPATMPPAPAASNSSSSVIRKMPARASANQQ